MVSANSNALRAKRSEQRPDVAVNHLERLDRATTDGRVTTDGHMGRNSFSLLIDDKVCDRLARNINPSPLRRYSGDRHFPITDLKRSQSLRGGPNQLCSTSIPRLFPLQFLT